MKTSYALIEELATITIFYCLLLAYSFCSCEISEETDKNFVPTQFNQEEPDKLEELASNNNLFIDSNRHCGLFFSYRPKLTSSAGVIETPDFDPFASYPPNLICIWSLIAPFGKIFKFYFLDLDLSRNGEDSVEFYDGDGPTIDNGTKDEETAMRNWTATSKLFRAFRREDFKRPSGYLQKFVGEARPFLSPSNKVNVVFRGSNVPTSTGFQLIYQHQDALVRSCPIGYRKCRSRTACFSLAQTCDGQLHCQDGTDEESCPFTGKEDLQFPKGCGVAAIRPIEGNLDERITGGRRSIPGSWPWAVSLRLTIKEPVGHTCGAVIVNRLWIITAAHCLSYEPHLRYWRAVFGQDEKLDYSDQHQAYRYLDKAFIVPDYEDEIFIKGNQTTSQQDGPTQTEQRPTKPSDRKSTSYDDIDFRLRSLVNNHRDDSAIATEVINNGDDNNTNYIDKANEAARMNNLRSRGDLALIRLNAPLPADSLKVASICLYSAKNNNLHAGRWLFNDPSASSKNFDHSNNHHSPPLPVTQKMNPALGLGCGLEEKRSVIGVDHESLAAEESPLSDSHRWKGDAKLVHSQQISIHPHNSDMNDFNIRVNGSHVPKPVPTTTTPQTEIGIDHHSEPTKESRNDSLVGTNDELAGLMAHVVGWDSDYHGKLRQAQVPVITNSLCQQWYGHPFIITPSTLCAGYAEGKHDACRGDSGGPLMVKSEDDRWFLIGIVSTGHLCAQPKHPGIYTRVSSYLKWIEVVIEENSFDSSGLDRAGFASRLGHHIFNSTSGNQHKSFDQSASHPETNLRISMTNKIHEGSSKIY